MKFNKAQKKFLSSVSAITVAVIVSAVIVGVYYDEAGTPPTVLVTDGGSVNDKSFNQQAYEAINNYKDLYGNLNGYIKPSSSDTTSLTGIYYTLLTTGADSLVLPGFMHENAIWDSFYKFMKPGKHDTDTSNQKQFLYIDDGSNNFQNKYIDGTDMVSVTPESFADATSNGDVMESLGIVDLTHDEYNELSLPLGDRAMYEETATKETTCYQYTDISGSVHNWDFEDASNVASGNKGWSANDPVMTDSTCNVFSSNDNVSSIRYYSEQSGFAVGVLSSMYVVSEFSNTADWVLGSWVGLAFSTTMDYLSGFVEGVNFFNEFVLGNAAANPYYASTSSTGDYVKVVSPSGSDSVDPSTGIYNPGNITIGNATDYWTSGGFELELGYDQAQLLGQKGAKVLFPIAGPQTKHALDYAETNKGSGAVAIGVDTDNSLAYPQQSEYVLTSALKTINSEASDPNDVYNTSGPVVKLLHDYQEYGIIEDYVGTISNHGVGFIESELLKESWAKFITYIDASGSMGDFLTDPNSKDWKTWGVSEFIDHATTYAISNNVQIAHGAGQPGGIQSIDKGIFGTF